MSGVRTLADLRDRCWVDVDTGCWHWRGARDGNGNPSLRSAVLRVSTSLGGIVCLLRTGERVRAGHAWVAQCAHKHCANPAHREEMSRGDMVRLRLAGPIPPLQRARISATKRARSTKMTPERAAEIRASGETAPALAKRHGISVSMAWEIRTGRAWAPTNPWRLAA